VRRNGIEVAALVVEKVAHYVSGSLRGSGTYVIPKVCVALVPIGTSVVVPYSQGIQANAYALLPITWCPCGSRGVHTARVRDACETHGVTFPVSH
jgi:hypothetical protein